MQMSSIPFGTTDWAKVESTEHKGERGLAWWRTRQFRDGRVFLLRAGMSYQVADNAEPHRSCTKTGAKLFIVD